VCTRGSGLALLGGPSTSPLERSMNRLYLISLIVGTAAVWLTQWALLKGAGYVYNGSSQSLIWYEALLNIFFALGLVVPGFCAGWISKRHGILLGALTGLIGAITYTIFFPIFEHRSNLPHFFATWPWLVAFSTAQFGLVLTCAAGGAAAELLRSNSRWRGP
jgi:uncharacterized membrane protein YeaQ/YmgE (transglycosylase-associated protein family)